MKISEQWLREWVNPPIDTDKLAEQLTMAGLEVATVTPVAEAFSNVVVGEVLEVNPHPNADKLHVCTVNVGSAEPLIIVCGAANVRVGLKVPTALLDAVLPSGFKIKKAKLRGVDSCGMLCSEKELGLAESSQGIWELPQDASVGMDVRQYLSLDDHIIDIELTANRGDCLSIAGVAREVSAIQRCGITEPIINIPKNTTNDCLPIKISANDACPHYCGRIIRNINIKVQSPLWLQERLKRSGLRSINPVVDVTNYVMLELGQPMHAFDLNKIKDEIQVRYSKVGEAITLLDDRQINLEENTLVIADSLQPLALAGVMGGSDSAVTDATQNIFLESAFFVPQKIYGYARQYSVQSDSSYRFERGVDPALQEKALQRATQLLLSIVGGSEIGPIAEAKHEQYFPQHATVKLRRARIKRVLGIEIADDDIINILHSLNMTVISCDDGWQVAVPSYRFDIAIEEDLLEEIARIYGYSVIPGQAVVAELATSAGLLGREQHKRALNRLMISRGYHETITYSFISPELNKLFNPDGQFLALTNPISPELSIMRTSLWPGLISGAKYNLARQQQRVRLFEVGLCFNKNKENVLEQTPYVGGITIGTVNQEMWDRKQNNVDFFDIKSDICALLKLYGYSENVEYRVEPCPALHPKRCAGIYLRIGTCNACFGYLGELHPRISQILDLPRATYLFEVNLSHLSTRRERKFHEISKFPAVRRDLAIIIDEKISWQAIKMKIMDIAGELLHNIQVFDVYRGDKLELGSDKKSIAIHLTFQHLDRTLVDAEVESIMGKIVEILNQDFNAILRG